MIAYLFYTTYALAIISFITLAGVAVLAFEKAPRRGP